MRVVFAVPAIGASVLCSWQLRHRQEGWDGPGEGGRFGHHENQHHHPQGDGAQEVMKIIPVFTSVYQCHVCSPVINNITCSLYFIHLNVKLV